MATQNDQKYESNYRRQSSAPQASYDPMSVADQTAKMQQEFDRRNRQAAQTQEQIQRNQAADLANLKIQGENAVNQEKDLARLGEFSKTLTDHLIEEKQKWNEEEKQAGIRDYYINGVPQEQQDEYDSAEADLRGIDAGFITTGAQVGAETGQAYMERSVRSMSPWRAHGYNIAKAQHGGMEYQLGLMTDLKKNFSVDLGNGTTLSWSEADTLPEMKLLMDAYRDQYLRKYSNLPPAMLNKHLFPQMKKAEMALMVEWGGEQEAKLAADKKLQVGSSLIDGVKTDNIVESFWMTRAQYAGDFDNRIQQNDFIVSTYKDMADNGMLTFNKLETLLDSVDPETGKKLRGTRLGQKLAALRTNITQSFSRAQTEVEAERKSVLFQVEQSVREMVKNQPLTMKDRQELLKKLEENNIDVSKSPWLQNQLSRDVEKDEEITERLDQLLQPGGRGFLLEAEVWGLSPQMREKYQKYVKDPLEVKEYADEIKDKEDLILTATRELFRLNTPGAKITDDTAAHLTLQRAQKRYKALFYKALKGGLSTEEASEQAFQIIRDHYAEVDAAGQGAKANQFLAADYLSFDVKLNNRVRDAQQQISEDPKAVDTGLLKGSEEEMEKLEKYAQNPNKYDIPEFYHRVAQAYPDLDGWDVAAAQYAATGRGDLLQPRWKTQLEGVVTPQMKRLLTNFPTASRLNRASYGGNTPSTEAWKPFLDLIASVESKAHGDYEAYNLGGSNNGHTAHGSGNSAEDLRFGKPLSQMTVAEVMRSDVWAAGRYQFIPGTLKDTVRELGIDPETTLFDAATQDQLAIARYHWRMRQEKSVQSLRTEWVGLSNVPVNELVPYLDMPPSPYNQAQALTPGVRRRVYTTGNIGPTSTGPHLDVKREDGERFAEDELDQWVEVDDPEFGTIGLGELRRRTGGVGDNFDEHLARGSHGIDYGTASGTGVYLKNGAKVVNSQPTQHGDLLTIEVPDGRRFTFLHGTTDR